MKRMRTLLLALALTATGCVELPIRTETKAAPGRSRRRSCRSNGRP